MNGDAPTKTREKRAKSDDDDRYGQTPKDPALCCDNCGVERITHRGTDPLTNVLRYVGRKCYYTIMRADDIEVLP